MLESRALVITDIILASIILLIGLLLLLCDKLKWKTNDRQTTFIASLLLVYSPSAFLTKYLEVRYGVRDNDPGHQKMGILVVYYIGLAFVYSTASIPIILFALRYLEMSVTLPLIFSKFQLQLLYKQYKSVMERTKSCIMQEYCRDID